MSDTQLPKPSEENTVNPYKQQIEKGFTGRLTVVQSVYHQPSMEEEAQGANSVLTLITGSDEQIYTRLKVSVAEEWSEIDTGWIDTPILILIQNITGSHYKVNPTEQQVKEDRRKVLEVSFKPQHETFRLIYPGCFGDLMQPPSKSKNLVIRCQQGSTKYNLFAFPGEYKCQ